MEINYPTLLIGGPLKKMYMKFTTRLEKSTNNTHYIPVPSAIALEILENFGKRIICIVNKNSRIHAAVMKNKNIGFYITVGKSTKKKINANNGDQLEIEIIKDDSQYKAQLSLELTEVLTTDPEGNRQFEQLTDGKKRSIIHYVNSAKQSSTRINRALKVMENLKMGITGLQELLR